MTEQRYSANKELRLIKAEELDKAANLMADCFSLDPGVIAQMTGLAGCPTGQAVLTPGFDIDIALEDCSQFLQEHEISIILAVYDQEMLRLVEELRKKAD